MLRNRRFQARNYFDPGKAPYTRAQSGFSMGGPIKRNRTFFYLAYERLDRHESQIVPLLADRSFLTSLTGSQQSLVDTLHAAAPTLAPLVNQLAYALVPAHTPAVVSLFEKNSGTFPFGEQRQQLSARVDHVLSAGHNLFFRGNWSGQESDNINFGALTTRSRGSNSNVNDFAAAFGDTWVINPRWVSETRVGFGYHDFGVYPTDKFGPAIDIGAISFGRDFILPVRVVERVFQIRQNFMRVSGSQTLKFGADINPIRDSAQGGGSKDANYGFNADKEEYGNLVQEGVIDPTMVTRTALQNAASIAGPVLTTEALVTEIPEKKPPAPAMPPGGDMY